MLRAAVVDRSKEHREYIKAALSGMKMDIQVVEFGNIYDFKESLDPDMTSYDILLTHTTIHREGDGIELAELMRKHNRKMMICFATDTQRYYAEAFSVFATGYLLYPFDISELYNCINFYCQKTKVERRASLMVKELGGNYKRIYCRNILFVESSNRKILLHMDKGNVIETYAKLDTIEAELPGKQFLRCHQSYIVSLYYVDAMETGRFLIGKHDIPVSRKYQKIVREGYYQYMFERM